MKEWRSGHTRVTVEHVDGSRSVFAGNDYWREYLRLSESGLSGRRLIDQLLSDDLRPTPRMVTLVVEGKEMARVKYE